MDVAFLNDFYTVIPEIMKKTPFPGILLSTKGGKNDNLMTIGWIEFGVVWQEPVVSVFVRNSRHTYNLLQEANDFTINVLSDNCDRDLKICASKSGKYCDKFEETGLVRIHSDNIDSPYVKSAGIVLECHILSRQMIEESSMSDIVRAKFYEAGDFHQMITGKIIKIHRKGE